MLTQVALVAVLSTLGTHEGTSPTRLPTSASISSTIAATDVLVVSGREGAAVAASARPQREQSLQQASPSDLAPPLPERPVMGPVVINANDRDSHVEPVIIDNYAPSSVGGWSGDCVHTADPSWVPPVHYPSSACSDWTWDRCDMPQHWAYLPVAHGHYYFRPYHFTHIGVHRSFAAQWGLNPVNPYDNRFFLEIYSRFGEELPELPPGGTGEFRLPAP